MNWLLLFVFGTTLLATDYGQTKAKSLILWGPNSNPNPTQINVWDVEIKAYFFVEIGIGWMLENWTKKVADSLAENTPNAPKFICPNCLPKPKSLGFRRIKASLGVHSPWSLRSLHLKSHCNANKSLFSANVVLFCKASFFLPDSHSGQWCIWQANDESLSDLWDRLRQ